MALTIGSDTVAFDPIKAQSVTATPAKNASFTLTAADDRLVIIDSSPGTVNVQLPDATTSTNVIFKIVHGVSGQNPVYLKPDPTINGSSSDILLEFYEWYEVISNGTEWKITDRGRNNYFRQLIASDNNGSAPNNITTAGGESLDKVFNTIAYYNQGDSLFTKNSNTEIECNTDGRYKFEFSANWEQSSGTDNAVLEYAMRINGLLVDKSKQSQFIADGKKCSITKSITVDLVATDTVDFVSYVEQEDSVGTYKTLEGQSTVLIYAH